MTHEVVVLEIDLKPRDSKAINIMTTPTNPVSVIWVRHGSNMSTCIAKNRTDQTADQETDQLAPPLQWITTGRL